MAVEPFYAPPLALMKGMGTQGKDFTYLSIKAYECEKQFAMARGSDYNSMRKNDDPIAIWKLLISSDVAESINHTWGKYEAMSGKLMELIDEGTKTVVGVKSIAENAFTRTSANDTKSINAEIGRRVVDLGLDTQEVGQTKLDASTVYQDSQNRMYNFEFEFVTYEDPKSEVYQPIRRLMELSCADTTDDAVGIKFPAIFEIATEPGGIVNIKNCALTSVQPTWKFPWKDGYPMMASVTLTFVEIPPLYRKTLEGKALITTSSSNKGAFKQTGDLRNNR